MASPSYTDLYFGLSDSRNEANEDRAAFVRTYVDLDNATESVVAGRKFLVLGPKGTGKSALAWYLEAIEGDSNHLCLVRDASDLPLAEVPHLQTGQPPGPDRTVVAWKFILLSNYLQLLLRDQGCSLQQNREAQRVAKELRNYGLMGGTSGRALFKISTTTVEIPIPKLGSIYKRENRSTLSIYNLIPYMEEWLSEAESDTRHVLLLDGLDSIFLNDQKYDESLASLVQAAYSLNQMLLQSSATGSISLLLRNDVFSRIALSLPDSQKMRDDFAINLDWRVLSGQAGVNAPLMQLVNKKASKQLGQKVDVIEYFPEEVEVGGKEGNAPRKFPVLQYLLNMTRHTPRDLLRLFDEIRKVDAKGVYGDSSVPISQDVIREGVLQYATKYFVGAIGNEFAGYPGGPESVSVALSALKSINKQYFDRKEFDRALRAQDSKIPLNADDLLRLLFYAGAIGNSVGGGHHEKSYMQFFHRREESEVYLHGRFALHHALVHAWGLRRTLAHGMFDEEGDTLAALPQPEPRTRRRTRAGQPTGSSGTEPDG